MRQPLSPPDPALHQPSNLGLLGGGFLLMLLLWPPLTIAALIIGPRDVRGDHWFGGIEVDPETLAAHLLNPLGTLAIIAGVGLVSLYAGWLLWRGRRRRDLWRIVFCLWLILPGRAVALSLLHWYMLWQSDVGIYDVPLRLGAILNAAVPAAAISAYLLFSPRMKRRFMRPGDNVAEVF